ncbi:UNVERIFIED_CONTAM: Mitotic-spindle organizing protein 1B [Sesamum calycinum]|uniref:Mitotic-spindle organizing protein 1B n=1 Tax=Sesamum calycinum TaxID=2727403 RepID=A0AAW2RAF0_9LAMI
MDPEAARTARDSLELVFHMSNILDTGLDRHTLSILIALCEMGLNPESLAVVVKELRRESPPSSSSSPETVCSFKLKLHAALTVHTRDFSIKISGTSNPDFGAGTSNLDFGTGTSNSEPEYYTPNLVTVTQSLDNIDFHYTEPTQSHTPLSENFIPNENDVEDPTADSFVNESDEASEPDEAEYPIPPEDGPDRIDINVMAETFAQRGAETSSEPALPDMNTQPTFYRSIPFFQQHSRRYLQILLMYQI